MPTLKFAPGVLEQLTDGLSQEEAQSLIDELAALAANGELVAKSTPVNMDELSITDPELYDSIQQQLDAVVATPPLH